MDNSTALALFRKCIEKYVEFNEAEWIIFSQHLTVSILKKKHYFVTPEKVCDKVGYIADGAVRYFHIKDGQDITGYFSFENEFVSSYKSFLTGQPGFTYIQALTDTVLVTFTRKDMDQMLANPMLAYKIERFGRLVAEQYLCCYEDRMASFITNARRTLSAFVKHWPGDIAAYASALYRQLFGHNTGFAIENTSTCSRRHEIISLISDL
jgi:CRP-like cAMP-binding protein